MMRLNSSKHETAGSGQGSLNPLIPSVIMITRSLEYTHLVPYVLLAIDLINPYHEQLFSPNSTDFCK